jgi:RNA polymerase sigma-70 factor (ECF subfamily)
LAGDLMIGENISFNERQGYMSVTSLFNEIYDSTNKSILAFITARCANNSDIDDIFQDTYMELYQVINKRGTDYVTDGKALVFKIAKRKIARNYSVLKRLKDFIPIVAENDNTEAAGMSNDDIADTFLTEDFVVDQMMLDNAKQLIKQKPADVEQIFYLFYDMDLSIPEIAQALSLSESNVKNKLYRTLKELRELLK